MEKPQRQNKYRDLEQRTYRFAKDCRDYVKELPKNSSNIEYSRQLIRSSGSQAANYIEANESLGRKDFLMKIRICRKESKESCLWLSLSEPNSAQVSKQALLIDEGEQLRKIFNSILERSV